MLSFKAKNIRIMLFFLWAAVAATALGYTKTVEIITSSDCDVVSSAPDDSFPYAEELKPDKNGEYDTNGELVKSYFRFDLPSDMGVVTAADFLIVQGLNGDQGALTYYIVAVNDDVEHGDSVNNYTWNNAPGNTPDYFYITWQDYTGYADPETSTLISTISVYYRLEEYGLYQTANLVNALNADTDGIFTLFAHRRQNYAVDPTFAAIENTYGANGPMLALTYESTGAGIGVSLIETDNETIVSEAGIMDSYGLMLDEIPDEPVTILLTPTPALAVTPDMLVFTGDNWNIPQYIEIQAINDDQKQPTLIYDAEISHAVYSNGLDYDQIHVENLHVSVIDNDEVSCSDVEPIREDLNHDCEIDILDYVLFIEAWLTCTDPAAPDKCQVLP